MAILLRRIFHSTNLLILSSLAIVVPLQLGGVDITATNMLMSVTAFALVFNVLLYLALDSGDSQARKSSASQMSEDRRGRQLRGAMRLLAFWICFSLLTWVDVVIDSIDLRIPQPLFDSNVNVSMQYSSLRSCLSYWVHFTAYTVLVWLSLNLSRRPAIILISIIAAFGFVHAIYGLTALVSSSETIFGIWPRLRTNATSGTFYNPNHFAGFMELCALGSLGLLLYWAQHIQHHKRSIVYGIGLIVLLVEFVAIVSTRSRLGFLAISCGIALFLVLLRLRDHRDFRFKHLIVIGTLCLCAGAVWFGLSPLLDKYITLFEEGNVRLDAWYATFEFPVSWWLLGIGPGRFSEYFPLVQPLDVYNAYFHLHNDLLQFVLEFGIVRSVAICLLGVYLLAPLIQLNNSTVKFGLFAGCSAMILHSIGDFNLQLPGVAVVFWIFVGLLMNQHITHTRIVKIRNQ